MKVMNVVFGISIAILIFIVVLLGTNVFYPRPEIEDFGCENERLMPTIEGKEFNATEQAEYQKCWDEFDEARDIYDRNFFLITSIIGFIAIIVSMFLLGMINIAAGTAFAGLALIVFGFMVGWQSTNDIIKFIIGLIIAVTVIIFAVIINNK